MERATWSALYTVTEMSAALRMAAARIAKHAGGYAIAEEINFAADCIEDLADRCEQGAAQAAAIQSKLVQFEKQMDHARELVGKLLS